MVTKHVEGRASAAGIWQSVWAAASANGAKGRKTSQGRILEAAAATFLALGYGKATVADILQRADISRRTFYQFFSSKEEALNALYKVSSGMLVHSIRLTINRSGTTLEQRLQAAVDAYITVQLEGGQLLSILQSEASLPESPLYAMRSATLDALIDLVMSEVDRGQLLRPDPLLLRTLLLGLESLCIEQHSKKHFDHAMAERIRKIAMPTLLGAIQHTANN